MIKAFTSTVANIITKEIQKGKNPGGGGGGEEKREGAERGEEREKQT